MERNFQNYIKGSHVPLLDMYEDVSPGKVDVLSYYEQLRIAGAERKLQVFYDRGMISTKAIQPSIRWRRPDFL